MDGWSDIYQQSYLTFAIRNRSLAAETLAYTAAYLDTSLTFI